MQAVDDDLLVGVVEVRQGSGEHDEHSTAGLVLSGDAGGRDGVDESVDDLSGDLVVVDEGELAAVLVGRWQIVRAVIGDQQAVQGFHRDSRALGVAGDGGG